MTQRNLQLFGPVRVESDDGDVPRFRSQRTMALLGYLVAEQRAVSRDALAALFWPDESQSKGRSNLRRELHNLNQILPGCWDMDRQSVQFAPADRTDVDLFRFLEFEQTEQWAEAAKLVRGEFLEGLYLDDNLEFETWLLGERERWRQRAETLLRLLIDRLSKQADHTQALEYARRLLQFSPWNEEAHQQVMRLLAKTGQYSAALKQFETCRQVLAEELAVELSAKTLTLVQRIQAAEVGRGHQLPAQATAFVGRETDLDALTTYLANPDCRLVTLVGPGGIGKTRLAIAAAERLHQRYLEGAYFTPLLSVTSAEAVVSAIAEALNLSFQEGRPPREQLLDHLHPQELLLVLDNLEQLLEESDGVDDEQSTVRLIEEILTAAAEVKIIATSREVLNLFAEQVYPVEGLPVSSDTGTTGIADLPAVELFQLRAQRAKGHSADFDEVELKAVADICHLAEGMPLAIELAAAQTRFFSPREMAESMSQNLDILRISTRGLSRRHQNIRAVFDVSWRSLKPEEQRIMAQLSIFSGGFTRHAAEAVVQAKTHHLSVLMDKSLIGGNAGRFELHTLLRQFAGEKLAEIPELEQQVQQRHFDYYSHLLEQTVSDWVNSYDPAMMDILRPEVENLRSGRKWILAQADWAEATTYLDNLWQFFNVRRRLPEAIELLNQALQVSQAARPPAGNIYQAHWERLLGESFLSMSQMGDGFEHFQQTLRFLGSDLPGGNLSLLSGVVNQLGLQMLHRVWPAHFVGRHSQKLTAMQELSYAYEKLGFWAVVEQQAFLSIYCGLRSLNLAETAGLVDLMARGYAFIGAGFGMIPLRGLAESYLKRAKNLSVEQDSPTVQVRVSLYWIVYYSGIGQWEKARAFGRPGTDAATKLGNHFDKEAIWVNELNAAFWQGRFEHSLEITHQLRDSTHRRGDIGFEAAAMYWEALLLLKLPGHDTEAAVALLEESAAAPPEAMNRFDYIIIYATLAQAHLRQDQLDLARQEADRAMKLIAESDRPTFGGVLHGYIGVADVYLALWETQAAGSIEAQLPGLARQACKNLHSFARIFPIGKPGAFLYQGLYDWLSGKPKKAHKAWQKSLGHARALEMPFDEGLAHYEIARHLPPDDAARQAHLEQATTIFTELGTGYDLERAKGLL